MESMPLAMMKHLEDDVPPVFMILDTFDKDIKVKSLLTKDYSYYFQFRLFCMNTYIIFLFYVLFLIFIFFILVIGKTDYLYLCV